MSQIFRPALLMAGLGLILGLTGCATPQSPAPFYPSEPVQSAPVAERAFELGVEQRLAARCIKELGPRRVNGSAQVHELWLASFPASKQSYVRGLYAQGLAYKASPFGGMSCEEVLEELPRRLNCTAEETRLNLKAAAGLH